MSWVNSYQLPELTWKKGQLSMNGLGSSQNPTPKPIWVGSSRNNNNNNDTLESIVHQATFLKPPPAAVQPPPDTKSATTGPCRKRIRQGDGDQRGCATAAASGGESDGTVMTWPLPASFQTSCKRTALQPHKDHASRARSVGNDGVEDDDEEESNKTETTSKTLSSANTRSRTSTVHNQSERRRRERINQKMKALQKLVPNAHKTDKASMLEEVIDYLKQLQAQVEMMSHARSLVAAPQMMIPFDAHALHQQQEQQKQQQQQHQLQMSILAAAHSATMGVGLGMGMVHNFPFLHLPTTMPTSPPQFLHSQVSNSNGASSSVGPFDALAQSKSMEIYMGNLAAIYQHQLHQLGSLVHGTHAINGASHSQQSYSYHNQNQGGR